MSFGATLYLYLLFIVPFAAIFFVGDYKRYLSSVKKIYGDSLLRQADAGLARIRARSGVLTVIILFLVIISLAAPRFGLAIKEIKRKSIDVIIAIDCSKSMLAEDIPPNRMTKAKELLSYLIDNMVGLRVGVIAFSGVAFTQCPLTFDTGSAKLFLDMVDTNLLPLPGTAINEAINLAIRSFPAGGDTNKSLILLTDGEDHSGKAVSSAKEAKERGIKIFTIGIGKPEGEPIPLRDAAGNLIEYKKNKKGEVIMTKLDENLLKEISAITGGNYYPMRYADISVVEQISHDLAELEKKETRGGLYSAYEHRFQYPLFLAILLLIAEILLPTAYYYWRRIKI